MEYRQIGNSGIQVAPLAFGGNVFGWTIDRETSFTLLDNFVEAGFNLVDTADVYSRWVPGNKGGESETIIGQWLHQRGSRDKVIIATKVGGDNGQGHKDISKKYILKTVEESLQRLQTDYIDIYFSHWDDEVTPVEETMEAYAQLIKDGKVRAVGASNFTLKRLKDSIEASNANGYPRYEVIEPLYNLYDREGFEKEMQPFCADNHIGVISYYALASGFLTGKYRSESDLSKSKRGEGNRKYMNERGFAILKALDEVAARYRSTPAVVSIAWLISRSSITAPIASATTKEQLAELTGATSLALDDQALSLLDEASAWQK